MEALQKPPRKTRFIVGLAIFLAAVATPVVGFGTQTILRHWAIATTPQSVSCLPWYWLIEVLHPVPHPYTGEVVLAHTRKAFNGAPLGKLVIGLPGDHVIETRHGIWVNGHFWGRMWLLYWMKHAGKPAPKLPERYTIAPGQVLLLGTNAQSLDGRYWGTVPIRNLYGTGVPL